MARPNPSRKDRAKRAALHARYAGKRGPDALQRARKAGLVAEPWTEAEHDEAEAYDDSFWAD